MRRTREKERKQSGRKRNSVVYLICEGSETEIRYFKRFRSRGCRIDILPIPSQYKAADKLVQKARATMGINPYYPDEGDVIWCVFDRDENTEEMLIKAEQTAKKEGYRIAFSNPAFEFWYLLHFTEYNSFLEDCQAVLQQLKKKGRLKQYEKNKDIYDELLPDQKVAKQRACKQLEKLRREQQRIISRKSNPVTTVGELTSYLNERR